MPVITRPWLRKNGRCSPVGSHLILPDSLICIRTRITGGELKKHQFTVEQSLVLKQGQGLTRKNCSPVGSCFFLAVFALYGYCCIEMGCNTYRVAPHFYTADNGNRTRLSSLGSSHSTDELYPHFFLYLIF